MTSPRSVRPSHPRVFPVADDSAEVLELSKRSSVSARKTPLNVVKTMAHHPGVVRQGGKFGGFLTSGGLLPGREREIVILRMGWRAQAIYEFGQHTLFAREVGMTDAEIRAVTEDVEGGPWSDDELTLIVMVDELFEDDCVSDNTWERLTKRWNPAELVELVLLAGFYRMVSGFLNTMGTEREAGVPGWPISSASPGNAGAPAAS